MTGDVRNTPAASIPEAKVLGVGLSSTVYVDYDVTIVQTDGSLSHSNVRIEFPDEVRSMLETSTWGRGASIMEAIARLGAAYVKRLGAAGLIRRRELERHAIFHLPLSDVRSALAAFPAFGAKDVSTRSRRRRSSVSNVSWSDVPLPARATVLYHQHFRRRGWGRT
jgi:hypothetical protein